MNPELPSTTIQLYGQVVTAVVAIATLIGTILVRRDGRDVHKQTVNGHDPETTNLRDDVDKSIRVGESAAASGAVTVRMLDEFRSEVRDAFKETRKDIGGLRQDLRDERRDRIEGDRRRDDPT